MTDSAAVLVKRQHAAPRRVNRPGTLRYRLRAVANGFLLVAASMALTALLALFRAGLEDTWFFVKGMLVFFGPAMLIYLFTRPRDLPLEASTLTTEDLIAAEDAATARAARQQDELQAGQRHLADLEALNASTEQQLVLDEPEPYAQLGASPFRDNFVPLEQRVVRPTQPAARPLTVNPPAPTSRASAAAVQPATVPEHATEPLPPAPKLLK
jgi:hypothetical protein